MINNAELPLTDFLTVMKSGWLTFYISLVCFI